MKVLICGGGTGGHIYPALAAVAELRRLGVATEEILWIGTHGEVEESLVPLAGLRLETITGGAIVGVSLKARMINAAKLTWSMGKISRLMSRFEPDVLFMTGGYVNVPVALVARLRRIPAAIYLPDVEPGAAIKFLSRFARRVACTTEASRAFLPPEKLVVTGYPVRPSLRVAAQMSRAEALARFDLLPDRPTLFIFGGSRGARSINRALMAILPQLLQREAQIIHVAGHLDWPEVAANAAALPVAWQAYYRPFPYLHEEMGAAFRAADLVVARAGASMLGECPAFGLPAVLVPYPHAWRYQKVNADYLVAHGAAVRLDDDQMPEQLRPLILELLLDRARLAAMATAATKLDKPDAAYKLAHLIVALGQDQERKNGNKELR